MNKEWHKVGGNDGGTIGSNQYDMFVENLSKLKETEFEGYFIYNQHDNKALFKLITEHFGNQEDQKLNFYGYLSYLAAFEKYLMPKINTE